MEPIPLRAEITVEGDSEQYLAAFLWSVPRKGDSIRCDPIDKNYTVLSVAHVMDAHLVSYGEAIKPMTPRNPGCHLRLTVEPSNG